MNKYNPSAKIMSFRGDYAFLSNFYETPVTYKGLTYRNSEAAFQAQKCVNEEDKVKFTGYSALASKRVGRSVKLRSDWEDIRDDVMKEVVRAKFKQNPDICKELIETGDKELVEGNTWGDNYWGVDSKKGVGLNKLGRILMIVREELRNE